MLRGRLASIGRVTNELGVGRRFGGKAAAVGRDCSARGQVWIGNLQGSERRASSGSVVLIGRRSGKRTSMASSATGVSAEGGSEVKDEQQPGVGVEGNGVAPAGEKLDQDGVESETTGADAEHGFTRPEMHSQPLVGSIGHFERHMFLCYKDPETWPAHVEGADYDRLPRHFVAALRARKNDMLKKTRLTLCEGNDGPDSSTGDVLMFPDMIRYRGLTHFDVDSFVEDVLVNGKEWVGSKPESLSGSHIFVCSHGSRDRRCGVCGPVLKEKLQEEINLRGLEGQIVVRPCSHIGGHKYAGNLIVFSSTGTDTVSGHWYGYVAPTDVPVILDQHIGKGEIIDRLWRGQMGINEADQKEAQQNRLGRQEDGKKGCACNESPDQANGVKEQNESACCQSTEPAMKENKQIPHLLQSTGSSSHDGHLIFLDDDSGTDEEPTEPRIKLWGSYYIPLPKWTETWEKEDTNAALAVVGAVATVAVAIHVYKKS